jgi:hypothetical protein
MNELSDFPAASLDLAVPIGCKLRHEKAAPGGNA